MRVEPLFQAHAPARASGSLITFEPGARTAWHTHPLGQMLIVTAGTGRVQRWGDSVEEIREGDVVWIPPGQKHWHGAAPNRSMAHLVRVNEDLAESSNTDPRISLRLPPKLRRECYLRRVLPEWNKRQLTKFEQFNRIILRDACDSGQVTLSRHSSAA